MRDYTIIKKKGQWYDAKVTDSFGVEHQNYYPTEKECIDWIYYMWENEKEPLPKDEEMELLAKAIWGCHKLDKKAGILSGNSDGLD